MSHSNANPSNKRKAAATAAASHQHEELIEEPTCKDVILGRGSAQAWRPGNSNFHDILDEWAPKYQTLQTKKAKRQALHGIYNLITQQRGRFLERASTAEDMFVEIEEDDALEKIGYAMRYRKKRILKVQAEMAKQQERLLANSNNAETEDMCSSERKRQKV